MRSEPTSVDDAAEATQAEIDKASAELEQAHIDQASAELEQAHIDQASAELEQAHIDQASAELEQAHIDQASAELEQAHIAQEAREQAERSRQVSDDPGQASQNEAGPNTTRWIRMALGAMAIIVTFTTLAIIALLRGGSNPGVPPGAAPVPANPTLTNNTLQTGQALVIVDMVEGDGRRITFRSTVNLTRDPISVTPLFRGKTTGAYREVFVSDQCDGFTVAWSGQVTVEVVANVENQVFTADIRGPVTQQGQFPNTASCPTGSYYAPHGSNPGQLATGCRWDGITDFARAAVHRSEPPAEGCTLEFGGGLVP